jgi:hypothetical protein
MRGILGKFLEIARKLKNC